MMRNLPAQPTQLLGREGDIEAACKLLQQPPVRLLSLLGHGGVGKSRLAIAIAESFARFSPDDISFVDLVPLTDPEQVIAQIAATLGLHDTRDPTVLERLKSALQDRTTLIVLDNFEHVVGAAPALGDLLHDCPRLKLLVTSRVPLHIQWERQFPVAPLASPDLRRLPHWTKLNDYAAVRLFVERARMIQPDFELTERNAETIVAICDALDGLPLAIELAAARVGLLSLAAIRDWLSHVSARRPLQLLTASYPDLPTRHLSLRAAIDWSYRLLTAEEQTVFRQLAVFGGDFSLESAESLAALEEAPESRVFEIIASLVDKNLLTRRRDVASDEGEARYQLLQTIREFGLEQLDAAHERSETQRRHALLFIALAEDAEREQNGANEALAFNRLAREWDNLRAALRWLLQNDPEAGLRLVGSLERFWEAHDQQGEGRQWLEAMLARAEHAPPAALAKALSAAGTMAWRYGDYAHALEWHQRSLDLYRACGDLHGCALTLNNVGVQQCNLGDTQAGAASYEESIALARSIGDAQAETFGLVNLGILMIELRDLPRAKNLLEQALVAARTLGSERMLVAALNNLGEVALGLGDLQAARDYQREAMRLSAQCDMKTELAYALEGLAGVYLKQRMLQRAGRLFGAADALRDMLQVFPHPSYRVAYYDPTCQALKAGLGDEAFDAAWAAGRATPLAEVVADALTDSQRAPDQSPNVQPAGAAGPLSRRECEVAALITRGLSNRQIADALVITEGTAANHVAHIMNKLDCHSRAQIAAWAVARGLADVSAASSPDHV